MSAKTIWVLTQEFNEYDQRGAYFICFWFERPSIESMRQVLCRERGINPNFEDWLNNKAQEANAAELLAHGRESTQDSEWFILSEETPEN